MFFRFILNHTACFSSIIYSSTVHFMLASIFNHFENIWPLIKTRMIHHTHNTHSSSTQVKTMTSLAAATPAPTKSPLRTFKDLLVALPPPSTVLSPQVNPDVDETPPTVPLPIVLPDVGNDADLVPPVDPGVATPELGAQCHPTTVDMGSCASAVLVIPPKSHKDCKSDEKEKELVLSEANNASTVYVPEYPTVDSGTHGTIKLADGTVAVEKIGFTDLVSAATSVYIAEESEGAHFAKGTTYHYKKYTDRKKKILDEFVNNFKNYGSKYKKFLGITSDELEYFPSQEPVEKLFVLLSGKENMPWKVEILNQMLIDWVKDKRLVTAKHGTHYPAVSSLNTMVHTLFAASKDYYKWCFTSKDFSFDGSYSGFFAALCAEWRKEDVSMWNTFKVITASMVT
jgi:hypothetical protein